MIRPYLAGMTKSELLAFMSGSMACIAGGILIVYVNMGVPAEYPHRGQPDGSACLASDC
jgi:CNT family concentrative nucleoside transporter